MTQVTIDAFDGIATTQTTFNWTIMETLQAPIISSINQQVMNSNTTLEIPIFVADDDTSFDGIKIDFESSNEDLIDASGFILSKLDGNYQVSLVPFPGVSGRSLIGIKATDKNGLSSQVHFNLVVLPELPRLSIIRDFNSISIDWGGEGILQLAPTISGPWIEVNNADNPYLPENLDAEVKFFRVISPIE